jgi:hypothetical protein
VQKWQLHKKSPLIGAFCARPGFTTPSGEEVKDFKGTIAMVTMKGRLLNPASAACRGAGRRAPNHQSRRAGLLV